MALGGATTAAPENDRPTSSPGDSQPPTVVEHHDPDAKNADHTAGMDDAARVLLVMSQADWVAFLDGIVRRSPRPPEFADDLNFALYPEKQGWNPGSVKGLTTGQVAWGVNQSEGLNIGFAPADGGRVQVFLFWHQT